MTKRVADLSEVRRHYARAMTANLPASADPRIREAFAAVPREQFLGPPPWTLLRSFTSDYQVSDPAELYVDALIPLDAARGINNGSPSLHALMLHLLGVLPGDRVLHAGAGTGYYTAILAELSGPDGHVTAIEYEAALAAEARHNLAPWPQVRVTSGDSAAFPTEPTERIYVNFAAADLPDAWLDHLTIGGRLVVPLGTVGPGGRHSAHGAVLVVTRTPDGFDAVFDVAVSFIAAEGPAAGTREQRRALFDAFEQGGHEYVRRLHRGPAPAGTAWLVTPRWSLCTV